MTNLICIVCPKGCHLSVDEENDYRVTGFDCPRGEAYGKKELLNPTRVVTSVVRIGSAALPCCPVKTSGEIPRDQIMKAMDLLKPVRLQAPVAIGDVVVKDICGTGINWVATRNIPRKERLR